MRKAYCMYASLPPNGGTRKVRHPVAGRTLCWPGSIESSAEMLARVDGTTCTPVALRRTDRPSAYNGGLGLATHEPASCTPTGTGVSRYSYGIFTVSSHVANPRVIKPPAARDQQARLCDFEIERCPLWPNGIMQPLLPRRTSAIGLDCRRRPRSRCGHSLREEVRGESSRAKLK